MQAAVRWVDGLLMIGESGSGHLVTMDGPPEDGGRNLAVRPMEMLLLGMGGCSVVDVITILKRGRQPVTDCRVEISAERAAEVPKVFTKIHLHYVVTGRQLNESQVKRAIDLSAEKYCSASIMLGKTAEVTHDFEVLAAE